MTYMKFGAAVVVAMGLSASGAAFAQVPGCVKPGTTLAAGDNSGQRVLAEGDNAGKTKLAEGDTSGAVKLAEGDNAGTVKLAEGDTAGQAKLV